MSSCIVAIFWLKKYISPPIHHQSLGEEDCFAWGPFILAEQRVLGRAAHFGGAPEQHRPQRRAPRPR
eukprot:407853-Pyramimonas_sp.AAC.1